MVSILQNLNILMGWPIKSEWNHFTVYFPPKQPKRKEVDEFR